jgi:GNAT superfamily N-acetyltransferase
METARLAVTGDRTWLGELATRAREEMLEKRGGDVVDRLDTHRKAPLGSIDELMETDGGVVVAGCIEGTPVGYGAMRVHEAADGRPHAVVEQIYVEPGARSVGVGEAILDLLIVEATERGAIGIEALALPGDRATKNFFETHGMVARAIIVHRRLDR